MRVQGYNKTKNNDCLQNVNIVATPFDVNVTINYLFKNDDKPANCDDKDNKHVFASDLSDSDLSGTVIMDVVVTTQSGVTTEPIRIHKRTLQKP
jgi:hypothetical protein